VLHLTLNVAPYTQCCILHSVLYLKPLLYLTLIVVPYTQCCILHSVLYLTLNVVSYTQCCTLHSVLHLTLSGLPTLPCSAHNHSTPTVSRWKCVCLTQKPPVLQEIYCILLFITEGSYSSRSFLVPKFHQTFLKQKPTLKLCASDNLSMKKSLEFYVNNIDCIYEGLETGGSVENFLIA